MVKSSVPENKRFDVALSFPGEHRNLVEAVAQTLAESLSQERVFYDKWYKSELARPNLDTYLQSIYHNQADLIVLFLCAEYNDKEWCGLELRAVRDLLKKKQDHAIMPIRLDSSDIPGLFSIDGYVDATNHTSDEIANLIFQRLDLNLKQKSSIFSDKQFCQKIRTPLSIEPRLHTFSFEYIQIEVKKPNLFIFRNKFDICKHRKQAKYFIEDIGGGIELEMIAVPAGEIWLGKTSYSSTESQNKTSVNSFFMSKYPITQAQWKAVSCLPSINCPLAPSPSKFQGKDHPVENVSWGAAVEFCKRLSRKSSRKYRLPTELEWEYACRAGTTTKFHFGDSIDNQFANFLDENNSRANTLKGTTPVNHFKFPNSFGLYDMHGNVYEWCLSQGHKKFRGTVNSDELEKDLNEDGYRVACGGSWSDRSSGCESSYRIKKSSKDETSFIGFRVICLI